MSHNSSKDKWNQLSQKEKELEWQKVHGTRLLPNSVSGSDLDNLFKKLNNGPQNQNYENQDNTWGRIPD